MNASVEAAKDCPMKQEKTDQSLPPANCSPVRVQRRRVKGWRMPPNTVSVCRPGRWGNPFKVGCPPPYGCDYVPKTNGEAVAAFSVNLLRGTLGYTTADVRRELRGKNLACFCPLDQPCHADVLLCEANIEENGKDHRS